MNSPTALTFPTCDNNNDDKDKEVFFDAEEYLPINLVQPQYREELCYWDYVPNEHDKFHQYRLKAESQFRRSLHTPIHFPNDPLRQQEDRYLLYNPTIEQPSTAWRDDIAEQKAAAKRKFQAQRWQHRQSSGRGISRSPPSSAPPPPSTDPEKWSDEWIEQEAQRMARAP